MNKIARNIYIDDTHWLKLKILAAKNKTSASKMIGELIKQKLIAEGKIEKEESVL